MVFRGLGFRAGGMRQGSHSQGPHGSLLKLGALVGGVPIRRVIVF